jgi:hypothetical protein
MKLFLVKLVYFCGVLLGLFVLSFTGLSWLAKQNAVFQIKSDTKMIILGHSHAECAYDDKTIENCENFAISGESYFYTYPKVKEIVRQNPGIKTVFLEFTNNQITEDVEKWIFEEKYLNYYYALYNPYIELEGHLRLFCLNPSGCVRGVPIIMKDLMKKSLQKTKYPYEYGGFKAIDGTLKEYNRNKKNHENEDFVEINQSISELQLFYLRKIIDFLKNEKIEIILIRTPQHENYNGFTNEKEYQKVLKEELKEVNYIDLSDFPLTDNHFRDPEHMNSYGATLISEWMNKILKLNLNSLFESEKHTSYAQIQAILNKK